nr:hypothetical protein [Bacilli bacterium]
MQSWSFNDMEIETINLIPQGDLMEALPVLVQDRPGFMTDDTIIVIPRYFVRVIGIEDDEDEMQYRQRMTNWVRQILDFGEFALCLLDGFDTTVDEDIRLRTRTALDRMLMMNEITPEVVVQLLEKEGVLPSFPKAALHAQIRENLKSLLLYYFERQEDLINPEAFCALLTFFCQAMHQYLSRLFLVFDYARINPKVLYYGDIDLIGGYFLLYLASFGCDVVYVNPQREGPFAAIDPNGIFSFEQKSYRRGPIVSLSVNTETSRIMTLAAASSKEVDSWMGTTASVLTKPWQCIGYAVHTKILSTTYDELSFLLLEDAMLRSGWRVDEHTVTIPTIFARIVGVHHDRQKDEKIAQALKSANNVLDCDRFPLSLYLSEEEQSRRGDMAYQRLRTDLTQLLELKIATYRAKPAVIEANLQTDDFEILWRLCDEVLQALMSFDFPKATPKIVIHNDEDAGVCSVQDAIVVSFLASLGFDIVIFSPKGYSDIDKFLKEGYIDMHILEKMDVSVGKNKGKNQIVGSTWLGKIFDR